MRQQQQRRQGLGRRDFLRRAGLTSAAALAATAAGARPAAAVDGALGQFPWGVASGDPLPDGVLLWTRVTPPSDAAPVVLTWRVARDVAMTDVVATGTVVATVERDHTVKVEVGSLAPMTYYFYDFSVPGSASIIGRTLTAPLGNQADRLRFGVVSCSNYTGGFFNAYATMARRNDLAAVICVGDYLYEYGNGADRYGSAQPGDQSRVNAERNHQPATEMLQLQDYRLRHATYKLDPDLRRAHQLFPWVTIWDDHESANNSRRDSAQNHQGTEGGLTWEQRKNIARRVYDEWMPIRTQPPNPGQPEFSKIYRRLRFGTLLDLIMIDTRLEGRDNEIGTTLNTVTTAEIDNPARRMISPAQEQWLGEALAAPGALWKIIGNGVILGQWNLGGIPTLPGADAPQFVLREDGNAINPDQWDGYTAERGRLFAKIRGGSGPVPRANAVPNVVVLTGDVHTSWALDLHENPKGTTEAPPYEPMLGTNAVGVEFVTPSITSANFESLGPAGVKAFEAEASNVADNPHVQYVDFASHGYYVLDVSRTKAQANWYYVDTILQPSENEHFGTAWRVLPGVNHLDRTVRGVTPATQDPALPVVVARPAAQAAEGPPAVVPEVPHALLIPVAAAAAVGGTIALRRRREGDATA